MTIEEKLAALQAQINSLKENGGGGDLDDLINEVNGLSNDVAALDADVTTLKTDLTAVQDNIAGKVDKINSGSYQYAYGTKNNSPNPILMSENFAQVMGMPNAPLFTNDGRLYALNPDGLSSRNAEVVNMKTLKDNIHNYDTEITELNERVTDIENSKLYLHRLRITFNDTTPPDPIIYVALFDLYLKRSRAITSSVMLRGAISQTLSIGVYFFSANGYGMHVDNSIKRITSSVTIERTVNPANDTITFSQIDMDDFKVVSTNLYDKSNITITDYVV